MDSQFSESLSTAASRDPAGGAASVEVIIAARRIDPRLVRRIAMSVIGTVAVLLVVQLAAQSQFDRVPADNPDGTPSFEHLLWRDVAAYVQLASFILPSLIAFFGFYLARSEMRDAIAGSFLITFMVVLTQGVVLHIGASESASGTLRETLLTNFMSLLGTIALFYFGSEAVIQATSRLSASRIGSAAALSADRPEAPQATE